MTSFYYLTSKTPNNESNYIFVQVVVKPFYPCVWNINGFLNEAFISKVLGGYIMCIFVKFMKNVRNVNAYHRIPL